MGDSYGDFMAIALAVVFCLLPTCVLQAVGAYSSHWVSNSTCDHIGLSTACCSFTNVSSSTLTNVSSSTFTCESFELDRMASLMHFIAAYIMLSSVIGTCGSFCCEDSDNDLILCGCLCMSFWGTIFYPVAGLLSFIGCMMLVPTYSGNGYTFGYSYGLCLTSGILVILLCVCLIVQLCRKKKPKPEYAHSSQAVQVTGGHPVASFESGGGAVVNYEQEERAAYLDERTGTFVMVMRKISITTFVRSIRHGDE